MDVKNLQTAAGRAGISKVYLHLLNAWELFQLADSNGQDSIVNLGLDIVGVCVLREPKLPRELAKGALIPLLTAAALFLRLAAALPLASDGKLVVLGLDLQTWVNGQGPFSDRQPKLATNTLLKIAGQKKTPSPSCPATSIVHTTG